MHIKISHLLFHYHNVRRQTGHHHLGAEHWQSQGDFVHQTCVSPEPAGAHCSLFPLVCEEEHNKNSFIHSLIPGSKT